MAATDGLAYEVTAIRGHVLTGCKVVATPLILEASKSPNNELAALEMEAEGVYVAAGWGHKQFMMIKGVSDFADHDKGNEETEIYREVAARASARFLRDALRDGNLDPP